MHRMRPSARLIKLLKPPSQMANSLDWCKTTTKNNNKNVATLHIGRDRIGVAIASHPEWGDAVQTVPPVRLQLVHATAAEDNNNSNNNNNTTRLTMTLAPQSVEQLAAVCADHEVGSFVVVWPLQKEGRAGASCGKVLHTLEALLSESDSVLTKNRPVCLWTGETSESKTKEYTKHQEDEWGRCAVYSKSSKKTVHLASQEQYRFSKGCSDSAADAWEAFCGQYWPDLQVEREESYNDVAASDAAATTKVRPTKSLLSSKDFTVRYSHPPQLSLQAA